jgi:hypothetical protein
MSTHKPFLSKKWLAIAIGIVSLLVVASIAGWHYKEDHSQDFQVYAPSVLPVGITVKSHQITVVEEEPLDPETRPSFKTETYIELISYLQTA